MAHSFCTAVKWLSDPKKCQQGCLISSAQSFYSVCLQLAAHSITCGFSGYKCHSSTRPGTSLHMTQFTRPSPALVLQATNAGMRRPGYEAMIMLAWSLCEVMYLLVCICFSGHQSSLSLPRLMGRQRLHSRRTAVPDLSALPHVRALYS